MSYPFHSASPAGGSVIGMPLAFTPAPPIPEAADTIQFVTPDGSDLNDGFAWSADRAKLTIPAAITALPSVGGLVEIAGYNLLAPAPITIDTKPVWVRGRVGRAQGNSGGDLIRTPTRVIPIYSGTQPVFNITGPAGKPSLPAQHSRLSDFGIYDAPGNPVRDGVKWDSRGGSASNMEVCATGIGFHWTDCVTGYFENCLMHWCGAQGAWADLKAGSVNGSALTNCVLVNFVCLGAASTGLAASGDVFGWEIFGGDLEGNGNRLRDPAADGYGLNMEADNAASKAPRAWGIYGMWVEGNHNTTNPNPPGTTLASVYISSALCYDNNFDFSRLDSPPYVPNPLDIRVNDWDFYQLYSAPYPAPFQNRRLIKGGVEYFRGSAPPGGIVSASRGDVYLNQSGGAGTTLYVKETGDNTTAGWVGK